MVVRGIGDAYEHVCILETVPLALSLLSLPHGHSKGSWVWFQSPWPYRSPFKAAASRESLGLPGLPAFRHAGILLAWLF